jgi:hypothetical protein
MMTFSFFVGIVWLGWSAMALGWPTKLASRVVILRPGFVGHFDLLAFSIGVVATGWWIWLIITAPRSPYRSLTHWTMGFTTLWLLATTLILPWFDYGKSYRPVAQEIAKILPSGHGCVAERGLSDTQRASLAYFVGIEPLPADSNAGKECNWVLVTGDTDRSWPHQKANGPASGKVTAPVSGKKNSASTGVDRNNVQINDRERYTTFPLSQNHPLRKCSR